MRDATRRSVPDPPDVWSRRGEAHPMARHVWVGAHPSGPSAPTIGPAPPRSSVANTTMPVGRRVTPRCRGAGGAPSASVLVGVDPRDHPFHAPTPGIAPASCQAGALLHWVSVRGAGPPRQRVHNCLFLSARAVHF